VMENLFLDCDGDFIDGYICQNLFNCALKISAFYHTISFKMCIYNETTKRFISIFNCILCFKTSHFLRF
jgi:hypothetical protein